MDFPMHATSQSRTEPWQQTELGGCGGERIECRDPGGGVRRGRNASGVQLGKRRHDSQESHHEPPSRPELVHDGPAL